MIKKTILLLLIFIPLLCNAGQNRHSFETGSDTFEIKYKVKGVTTSRGVKDLVLYSVYKNGNFVHSHKEDGGRFFSCRSKKPDVIPVKTTKNQIGWMLIGGGICGNTSSYKVELIIPVESGLTTYYTKTFTSKVLPLIQPLKNGLSIWYYEQNWGRGGTATSFYVPNKIVVDLSEDVFNFKKGDILKNIEVLEKSESPEWLRSFLGFFVAGLRDVNPELMQYALDNHYTLKQQGWIAVHFDKADKEYLQQIIHKVKVTKDLLKISDGVTAIEPAS
jgi:hypothetical protein